MNSFSASEILYYPTIEFQSDAWIKTCLLFWDKIYRIVPEDYLPRDSDETKIAISNGFIENITLSKSDLAQTADKYETFYNNLDFKPACLDTNYCSSRLHADKVEDRLKPFFLSFAKAIDRNGFFRIPPEIANGYMFFLADTVSNRRNISKLTDSADKYSAMIYFEGKGCFDEWLINPDNKNSYMNMVVERLVPKDIEYISMDTTIKLIRKMESE